MAVRSPDGAAARAPPSMRSAHPPRFAAHKLQTASDGVTEETAGSADDATPAPLTLSRALAARRLAARRAAAEAAASAGAPVPLPWELIVAARDGDAARARDLLARGADPRASNNLGTTPLMEAARQGNAALIAELLAAGADVNATDVGGGTALLYAADGSHADAVDALLAARSADADAANIR